MAATGGGNPNFFKTFKGKFELQPLGDAKWTDTTVMLSCVNDVQFLGDCTSDAAGNMGTLPVGCRPKNKVVLVASSNGTVYPGQQIQIVDNVIPSKASIDTVASLSSTSGNINYINSVTPKNATLEYVSDVDVTGNYGVLDSLTDAKNASRQLRVESSETTLVESVATSTAKKSIVETVSGKTETIEYVDGVTVSKKTVNIPGENGTFVSVIITPDGRITSYSNRLIYLNGISFHISDNWY